MSHEVSIRYRDGVTPDKRFKKGSRIFEIVSAVDPAERGRELLCVVKERV